MPINESENSEEENQEALNSLNADLVRLQEQIETLSKSKELIVIRYANSEKEVFKLIGEQEKAQKQIKTLMKDNETLNQKNKQLTADKTHFSQLAESKNSASEEENKRLRLKVTELQSKQTELQNELKGLEITKSQRLKDFANEKQELQNGLDESLKMVADLQGQLEQAQNDITELKRDQEQTQVEDTQNVQKLCDKLKQDLASKEFVISWTQDRVLALECECEQVRHNNVELLNDMSNCRAKEAELVAYTQAVTEKNVSLQSKLSSMESKISALEEENIRFVNQLKESDGDIKGFEKTFLDEQKEFSLEKQKLLDEISSYRQQIIILQQQLDEAKGEVVLLRKKHDASLKELNKELRRQKDSSSSAEVMSQSSRTSSCSSLNTIEANVVKKGPEISHCDSKQDSIEYVPLPDQQILVDRIVKLQRMLAKKQDKIEFLEDNGRQLIDELQKKCRIVQKYALSQDTGALSTEVSDKNKAEMSKHGGIMASLYTSKPSDELSSELTQEINSKLQAVLEDTLLKNITLKEGMDTLAAEVHRLTELNKQLLTKQRSDL